MEIPKKIKICGFNYDIEIKKMEGPSNWGMHVKKDLKIYLNDESLNRQNLEECFLHEILHGINDVINDNLSEKQIGSIARLLYQVLNDNNLLR